MRATLKYVEVEIDEEFPSQRPERDESAKQDIRTLLNLIPPAQAEVIEMVKLQEMSVREVSEKTGHSPSSVKKMKTAVQEMQDEG